MPVKEIIDLIMRFLPYGVKFAEAMLTAMHKKDPTLEDWLVAVRLSQTPFHHGIDTTKLIPDPVVTGASTVLSSPVKPPA